MCFPAWRPAWKPTSSGLRLVQPLSQTSHPPLSQVLNQALKQALSQALTGIERPATFQEAASLNLVSQ